jgi:hypothetical protein
MGRAQLSTSHVGFVLTTPRGENWRGVDRATHRWKGRALSLWAFNLSRASLALFKYFDYVNRKDLRPVNEMPC